MTDKITIERETLERAIADYDFAAGNDGAALSWIRARDNIIGLLRAALAAQPVEQGMVRLPESAEEARAMALIGEAWLRQHAPEMLKPAQQAEPQEPVASYWLIECKNGFTGWYTGHRLDCRFFDTDPRKAYKFASKELAENEISERGHSCMIATEHVDIAAPPAEPPTDAWRMAVDAAMVGHALDCTTPDSDPATCVALLVKQVEDIWRDIAAQPAPAAVPAAWKHDCAGLCTNDVELWIDACPHCGKPRPVPPAPAAVPPDDPGAVEYIAERLAFDSGVRWRALSYSERNVWRDIARKKRLNRIAAGDKP